MIVQSTLLADKVYIGCTRERLATQLVSAVTHAPDAKYVMRFWNAALRDESYARMFIALPDQCCIVADPVVLHLHGAFLTDQVGPRLLSHRVKILLELVERQRLLPDHSTFTLFCVSDVLQVLEVVD